MDCHAIGLTRGCLDKQLPCFPWVPVKSHFTDVTPVKHNLAFVNSSSGSHKLRHLSPISIGRRGIKFSRSLCMSVGIEEHSSSIASEDGNVDEDSSEETPAKPLSSIQLKSLLADSERAKLVKKLSEANQQNRFLKRQLLSEEDALVNFKSELAVVELELQALVALAEEITKYGVPKGSRKINGKYIQSHLLSRLEAVQEKIKDQIKDVEVAQPKEVPLFWVGMAESVQVMGSFDGWSQGEHLSLEYTGSFARFSTTLWLRPGRYEIKFMVDGQWHLSPEFPTVGEGLTENNFEIGLPAIAIASSFGKVVNGFFCNGQPLSCQDEDDIRTTAFGLIPLVTGSDFARSFDWKNNPHEVIDRIAKGVRSWVDVGIITVAEGEPQYFINVADIHLSAKAGYYASRYKRFGNLCYVIGGLQAFLSHQNQDLRLKQQQEISVHASCHVQRLLRCSLQMGWM